MSMKTHVHARAGDLFVVVATEDTFAISVDRGDLADRASAAIFITPEQASEVVAKFSAGLKEREMLADVRAKIAEGAA